MDFAFDRKQYGHKYFLLFLILLRCWPLLTRNSVTRFSKSQIYAPSWKQRKPWRKQSGIWHLANAGGRDDTHDMVHILPPPIELPLWWMNITWQITILFFQIYTDLPVVWKLSNTIRVGMYAQLHTYSKGLLDCWYLTQHPCLLHHQNQLKQSENKTYHIVSTQVTFKPIETSYKFPGKNQCLIM